MVFKSHVLLYLSVCMFEHIFYVYSNLTHVCTYVYLHLVCVFKYCIPCEHTTYTCISMCVTDCSHMDKCHLFCSEIVDFLGSP